MPSLRSAPDVRTGEPQDPRWFVRRPWVAIILANAIGLTAIEVVLRAGLGDRLAPRPATGVIFTRETHHDYEPGVRFVRRPDPGDVYAPVLNQINRLGMRGPDVPAKRACRVLIVGDSTVQADEIPFDDTAWQMLARAFDGRIEFLAHGMASWSPTPEFSWIRYRGLGLEPDEVVVFLDGNDFFRAQAFAWADQMYRRQVRYEADVPVAYDVPLPGVRTTVLNALRHLEILRLSEAALRRAGSLSQPSERGRIEGELAMLDRPDRDWPSDLRQNVDETLRVIQSLDAFLRQRGVRLRATLVPPPFAWPDEADLARPGAAYGWTATTTASHRGLEAYIRPRLDSWHIAWIDLRAAVQQAKTSHPEERYYLRFDGHWNTAGHRVVADALRSYYSQPAESGHGDPAGCTASHAGGSL